MRAALRLARRAVGLVVLCAAAYLAVVVTTLAFAAIRRSSARARIRIFGSWCRALLRLLDARVEVLGTPPRPPFFLVSNHLSYVDIALLGSRAASIFVARGDLARWPVFGALSRSVGTFFVDRESKRDIPRVAAEMETALGEGIGIVLFPEGTSTNGRAVLPFRPALFEPAVRLGIPVHWAAISYRTAPGAPAAEQAVCWWNDAGFLTHLLGLLRLAGFEARLVFGEDPVAESDRKALARSLHEAVRIAACAPWSSSPSPAADTSSATTGTRAASAPGGRPPRSTGSATGGSSRPETPTGAAPGSGSTPPDGRSAS